PDLSPAQAARLDPALVDGIVLAFGSSLSHGAILARSLGIPAVVAAGADVLAIPDGSMMVVDGTTGCVAVDPAPDVLAAYRARAVRALGASRPRAALRARCLGIPAVVAAGADVPASPAGSTPVGGGTTGGVAVDPAPGVLAAYRARAGAKRRRAHALAAAAVQ